MVLMYSSTEFTFRGHVVNETLCCVLDKVLSAQGRKTGRGYRLVKRIRFFFTMATMRCLIYKIYAV